jgi:hypothetical protein
VSNFGDECRAVRWRAVFFYCFRGTIVGEYTFCTLAFCLGKKVVCSFDYGYFRESNAAKF